MLSVDFAEASLYLNYLNSTHCSPFAYFDVILIYCTLFIFSFLQHNLIQNMKHNWTAMAQCYFCIIDILLLFLLISLITLILVIILVILLVYLVFLLVFNTYIDFIY